MVRAHPRLALGRRGPADLGCLRDGLAIGEQVTSLFASTQDPLRRAPEEVTSALQALNPDLDPDLARFRALLTEGLGPDLPSLARDGGFVAANVRPELDQARALRDDSRRVILQLEARLVAESGVALKVRHNAVLGYFVETTAKAAEPLTKRR